MLISGASCQQYGRLKDKLANDYLLGSDHYPDTLEKAGRILANYQNTRASAPYRASGNKTGVTFLQRRGRAGWGAGRGGQEGRGAKSEGKSDSGKFSGSGGDNVSTITGRTSGDATLTARGSLTASIAAFQATGHMNALNSAGSSNPSCT